MLIWAESFDCYGTSLAELAKRGYITSVYSTYPQVVSNVSKARTGNGYLFIDENVFNFGCCLQRVLEAPVTTLGIGFGLYMETANSSGNNQGNLGIGVGSANPFEIKVVPNNANGITVWQGTTQRGSSAPNILVQNAWFHIEARFKNNTAGGVEGGSVVVRVNGDTVLEINGLNIPNTFARTAIGTNTDNTVSLSAGYSGRFDDWVIWDGTGTRNNNFIGERRCVTSYVNANSLPMDWAIGGGAVSQAAAVSKTSPNDATYIIANNANDIAAFGKQSIGLQTNDIAGVCVIARAWKPDSGTSKFRVGVTSGITTQNSGEFAPGVSQVYYSNIFERDPNGDLPWNLASLDAANIRVTRSF